MIFIYGFNVFFFIFKKDQLERVNSERSRLTDELRRLTRERSGLETDASTLNQQKQQMMMVIYL